MTPGIAAVPRRPPHPPGEATGGPLVSFTRSNLAVHWGSAFHSLLELAEACDVPVRWSCRTGVCHNWGLIQSRCMVTAQTRRNLRRTRENPVRWGCTV
jgi:hypothetical protein